MRIVMALMLIAGSARAENFKEPVCLAKAVDFWYDVYTKYDKDKGVVFETETLEIMEVVDLPDDDKKRMDLVRSIRSKYEKKGIKIRVQKGVKSMFEEGIVRYKKHKKMVVKNIKAQGLPLEIKVLPHVESGYNPKARSKVGAVGMWQVMPGTAKMYGFDPKKLKDPEYNTKVGIQVLVEKHKVLKSWPLAITAYNHGLRGIQRAVKETGSRDICQIIEQYDGPRFGVASRNFYANFLTVLKILRERGLIDERKNKSK